MNKTNILAVVIIAAIGLAILMWPKSSAQLNYEEKIALAKETHKAVSLLMKDLSQAKASTIQEVVPDGEWHNHITFSKDSDGKITYGLEHERLVRVINDQKETIADHIHALRLRRLSSTPGIIEVQAEAKNKLSLVSNFKIRLRE